MDEFIYKRPQPPFDPVEYHKHYDREYQRKNCRQFKLSLNTFYDRAIIDWLDAQENKQGAIKALIEQAIKAGR